MNKKIGINFFILIVALLVFSTAPSATFAASLLDNGRPPQTTPSVPSPIPDSPPQAAPNGVPEPNDIVQSDDLIVMGSLCVGVDCINNEAFSFDTIRLKENNTQINFDDTSTSSGFPANDWRLTANDSINGGESYFSIVDVTGASVPFKVMAGAPTNAFYVSPNGFIGLGTSTPVLQLQLKKNDTPAIRLEQTNAAGYSPYTWDVAGNEANFFIRDVTGGSKLVFRIRPGAPENSIYISNTGNVGIGLSVPTERLHVNGNILANGYVQELSDRNAKTGFNPVDGSAVLDLLAEMPITTWSYKNETGVIHMGPVAQDFYAAFGLGQDNTHLAALDVNGVSLTAIQALNEESKAKDVRITDLENKLETMEARMKALETRSTPANSLSSWPFALIGLAAGLASGALFSRRKR